MPTKKGLGKALKERLKKLRQKISATNKRHERELKKLNKQQMIEADKLDAQARNIAKKNQKKVAAWAKRHPKAAYESGLGVKIKDSSGKIEYKPLQWL